MKKQTAVELMFDQLWETPKDKLAWFKILMDAKEMDKEQMHDTWVDSRTFDKGDNYFGKQKSFDEYYNETYGDK
jgi:hypothetical protein